MLIEIQSDVFRRKKIAFHQGLNVILGDEQASNSIGKSNLLLIIDFIFGGSTYLEHSVDVIENVGEHSFYFAYKFDKVYKFKRSTENENIVFVCNDDYTIIEDKSITIEEFRKFLQEKYKLDYLDTTFRAIVGAYIRVWGKDNYDEKKPLKTYKNDSNEKLAINNLIKLFDKYTQLKSINEKIDKNNEDNKTINAMYRTNYAHKITKAEYISNLKEIEDLKSKMEDIKENLQKYIVNIEELINREVIELKTNKNHLLIKKNKYVNQLLRINKNLEHKSNISSKHLEKLKEFFPHIAIKKINEIEGFHKNIRKILSKEIEKTKKELEIKIVALEEEIVYLDEKMASYLNNNDKSSLIVDELLEYTTKVQELEKNTKIYEEKNEKLDTLRTLKDELSVKLSTILGEIKVLINEKMSEISKRIDDDSNPPIFEIEDNKYKLYKPNDMGTGTSKLGLIIFDLSILQLTKLPLLVHDSILFKDIGNKRVEQLIRYYSQLEKQAFIAIDEHKKYGNAIGILESKKVIKLDEKNTLYNQIWSNKSVK